MSKKIVEKAKSILKGIEFDLELAFVWRKDNYDNYYQYFDHPDDEVRKYALLVFAGGLGNWCLESAHIFSPEKYDDFDKGKSYYFEDYIQSFLDHQEAIKQEFPLLYSRVVWYLLWLDNKKPFDTIFTATDKQLFIDLRQLLAQSGIDQDKFQNNHEDIIKEVGLTLL